MITHDTASRIPGFMPFQEPITYYKRMNNDAYQAYDVDVAHRKKLNKEDYSAEASVMNKAQLVWSIIADWLYVVPATDDYLVDQDGVGWTVVHVEIKFNGRVYDLVVRQRV